MDDIEELFESFRTLYACLEKVRVLEGPELLLPGHVKYYRNIVEDAYAAYGRIETKVDELGQQLEEEHRRLDEGIRKYG
jgi:hypothetical protein